MKCPEDGGELEQEQLLGLDKSYRCKKCGGCLIEGWVINAMAEGKKLVANSKEFIVHSQARKQEFNCPADEGKLMRSESEELPSEVEMWKCEKCKKWWLPGNSIFDLEKAFEVRQEYQQMWKKKRTINSFALPIVLTLVLAVGLGMVIRQVGLRQMWMSEAAIIQRSEIRYVGAGRVEIRLLVKGDLGQVEYRKPGESEWKTAPVVTQGEWRVAVAEGLKPNDKFLLKWNGKIVQVTVGKQE